MQINNLSIYPNPAKDLLTIKDINGTFEYTIYSSKGEIIMVGTATDKNTIITISDIVNGLYFIQVKAENQTNQTRFIRH